MIDILCNTESKSNLSQKLGDLNKVQLIAISGMTKRCITKKCRFQYQSDFSELIIISSPRNQQKTHGLLMISGGNRSYIIRSNSINIGSDI